MTSSLAMRLLLHGFFVTVALATTVQRGLSPLEKSAVGAAGGNASPSISAEVAAVNGFGFRLLKDLAGGNADPGENVFMSPVSVSTALAMAALGATADSYSLTELEAAFGGMDLKGGITKEGLPEHGIARLVEDALGSQWAEGSGVSMKVANGGWFKAPVLESYKSLISGYFNATSAPLNRGQAINRWVSDNTDGLITDIIQPGLVNAIAVLVNAIHFKGSWGTKFDESSTREAPFQTASGPVDVNMMFRELPQLAECRAVSYPKCVERDSAIYTRYEYSLPGGSSGIEVAEIGFGTSGDYSAVFMMPVEVEGNDDETHSEALNGLTAALADDPELWSKILAQADQKLKERNAELSMGSEPDEGIQIRLPRFKIETKKDLVQSLRALGIVAPFSNGMPGQFEGISEEVQLYIQDVTHAAALEVNEDGAESAVANAVVFVPLIMNSPSRVQFNRPFLVFITNKKTGTVLFSGRVNDPSSG